jgi:23S rRNA pseudouridine2605 synthase
MRENEKFGKKPVKRSNSDENQTAKVYRPRTASVSKPEPKEKIEPTERSSDERPTERRTPSPSRRDESRSTQKGSDNSPAYKPRTLKTKATEDDRNERRERFEKEKSEERDTSFDRDRDNSRSSRPSRSDSPRRERDSDSRPSRSSSSSRDGGRDSRPSRSESPRRERDSDSRPSRSDSPRRDRDSDSRPSRSSSSSRDGGRDSRPSRSGSSSRERDSDNRPSRSFGRDKDRDRDFKKEGRFDNRKDATKGKRFDNDSRFSKDKDSSGSESKPKSFYEDKFSKPIPKKFPKLDDERTERSDEDRLRKRPKAFITPPEIENELKTDKDGNIRLNKYIANSGLCSRREADEYIQKGLITINGVVVTELGTKVKLEDEINFRGKQLDPEKKVYILLNKPKDYITTVEDPNATHTVMELISGACDQRVYPVGRLDRNSTGLLLFTNDGELTKRLTHPSFMKKKIYEVGLDKPVRTEDITAIRDGVEIEGEIVAADAIEHIDESDRSLIGIEIHSGQNRIVRRIFEKLGYKVYKLDRVYFAGLTKKNLPRGKWRFLSQKEVNMLKMNRYE